MKSICNGRPEMSLIRSCRDFLENITSTVTHTHTHATKNNKKLDLRPFTSFNQTGLSFRVVFDFIVYFDRVRIKIMHLFITN